MFLKFYLTDSNFVPSLKEGWKCGVRGKGRGEDPDILPEKQGEEDPVLIAK